MNSYYELSLSAVLAMVLAGTLSSCSSPGGKSLGVSKKAGEAYEIKRSWVRRLSPEESLRTNEISQNFKTILKENGNIIQASSFGGIFELNKYGRKIWSFTAEEGVAGAGSVYKNFVFLGTQDKTVHAYDTADKTILWSTKIEGAVSSVSDFSNGKIFVLTDKGSVYALQAADGVIEWTASFSSRKPLNIYGGAKPVIFKDKVIVAFPSGLVASFEEASGKVHWKAQLEGGQKHSDVDFLSFSDEGYLIAGVFDVALYRLDLSTGKVVWQAYEKPVSSPTIFKGNIYFSTASGELVSLGLSSGNLISKKKVFKGLGGSPLFLKDQILVSDSKGPIRYMDRESGKVLATYDMISPTSVGMTLNKTKDKFYLLSDKGYLYYFGVRR